MKRKLALLLAAAMTLSLLPTTSLFAASNNTLTGSSGNVSAKTVLVEQGLMPNNAGTASGTTTNDIYVGGNLANSVLRISNNSNVSFVQGAPYLRIEPRSAITAGSQITLSLNGAEWFFVDGDWSKGQSNNEGYADPSSIARLFTTNSIASTAPNLYDITSGTSMGRGWLQNQPYEQMVTLGTPNADNYYNNLTHNHILMSTPPVGSSAARNAFNLQRSYRTVESGAASDTIGQRVVDFVGGTYVRANSGTQVGALGDSNHIYEMTLSADKRTAYVTFPNDIILNGGLEFAATSALIRDPFGNDTNNDYIYIPLVVRTTASEDDVTVTLNGNNTSISSGTYVLGGAVSGGTNAYVDDPQTARDEFPINMLLIQENRAGTMGRGTFEITAPSGYDFSENAISNADPDGRGVGFQIIAENFGYGPSKLLEKGVDYNVSWKMVRGVEDYSSIQIQLITMNQERSNVNGTPGTLVIQGDNRPGARTNFRLIADETVAFDTDINLTIRNIDGSSGVSRQNDVKAGTRKDWTISLTTSGDIPTLINGRYFEDDAQDADDETHLAAGVVLKENVENAWWSGRVTTFTLPEGVKVRKAEIRDTVNLEQDDKRDLEAEYTNDNRRINFVTVNDNEVTISGVRVENNPNGILKKATIELDLWLSIESGFEGDIELTAGGSAIPEEVPPVVIAKAISPISVTAEVTPVQIGHQYVEVADITIQENVAGALERNKQIWITVTDRINLDMYFTPGYAVEVTEGNINIRDRGIAGGSTIVVGNASFGSGSANLGGGTIAIDVDGISSTASTIKLSNLQLKIDRTVPESTAGYKVYVWGPNVAPNSDIFDYAGLYSVGSVPPYVNRDLHRNLGISTEYVTVATPATATEGGSALSAVVKVTVDNPTAYRDGEAVTINPAPFIDASSRLQVPVRALSNLLGVTAEQIIWSDADRTVTINLPNRVIQFAIGSNVMLVNGAQVRMDTEAMIKDDWTFIPFRSLGEALGVQVSWDDTTKTATYNSDLE